MKRVSSMVIGRLLENFIGDNLADDERLEVYGTVLDESGEIVRTWRYVEPEYFAESNKSEVQS